MIRLCFNNKFNSVIEEYSDIWKTEDNMPTCIKSFIDEVYDSRVIYELNTEKYYCSNCLKELDKDYKCPKCNKQYTNINTKYLIRMYDIKEIEDNNYSSYYYVYDIYNGDVVLYKIKETIYYDNPLTINPYKTRKLEITNAYLVRENGLNDQEVNQLIAQLSEGQANKIDDMMYYYQDFSCLYNENNFFHNYFP